MSSIVLFDGVCKFCNRSVQFIIDRDKKNTIRFAPLQSDRGRELLEGHGLSPDELDTMVLIEDGRAYTKTDAALRISRRLRQPWPLLYALIAVPRRLRDWAYDAFARRRYKWFGNFEACPAPDPENKGRFLD